MGTQSIEKQFQMWIHFLWMILGASMTFASVGFGNLIYILLAGSALFLGPGYSWLLKRTVLPRDEIFP